MAKKVYCYECDKEVSVTIKEEKIQMDIKGVMFSYVGNIAFCEECGSEVYLSELDDENIKKGNEVYRDKIGIIKVQEIFDLLKKYNIGKDPLAELLGWGVKTITRYCSGLMPSKGYSDRLKELFNPYKMYELFQARKDILTEIASKKLELSIQKEIDLLLENSESNDIKSVSKYLLNNYGYRISLEELSGDTELKWLIKVPELDGCVSLGKTLEEAFRNLESTIESWITSAKKKGKELPKNKIKKVEDEFKGNLAITIPKRLYQELLSKSEHERLNLNEYVIFLLTKGLYDNEDTSGSLLNLSPFLNVANTNWEQTESNKILSLSNRRLALKGDGN